MKILIADDHPLFRQGLAALVAGEADFEVVGLAGTGQEAAELALQQRPDVAVLDLRMPAGGGLTATAAIRRDCPGTRILVLTSFEGPEEIRSALAAGAHGYLVKSAPPNEIIAGIRAVGSGAAVVSDAVLAQLRAGEDRFPELSEREGAVLSALAGGLTTEEAASSLGLTSKTVRNYVASITAKLGVRDRAAAIRLAQERRG